jgi:ABC-type sugar transport system ATPase subunit
VTFSRHACVLHGGGVIVDSVRKLFGSFEAIEAVSFKMERGKVTALLGQCVRCCFQC